MIKELLFAACNVSKLMRCCDWPYNRDYDALVKTLLKYHKNCLVRHDDFYITVSYKRQVFRFPYRLDYAMYKMEEMPTFTADSAIRVVSGYRPSLWTLIRFQLLFVQPMFMRDEIARLDDASSEYRKYKEYLNA